MTTKRLYIGNLSPSVDEYTLLQVCIKFGKISKLDFLFHKSGPDRGKSKGFAFVEYSTKEEALKALVGLDKKLVRGRNITVNLASEQDPSNRTYTRTDPIRPTNISVLKSQSQMSSNASTNRKIAALEAKLRALRKSKPGEETKSPDATSEGEKNEPALVTDETPNFQPSTLAEATEEAVIERSTFLPPEFGIPATSTDTDPILTTEKPSRKRKEVPEPINPPPKRGKDSLPPKPTFV